MSPRNIVLKRLIPKQPGSIIKLSEQLTCLPPISRPPDLSRLRSPSLHMAARAFPFSRLALKLSCQAVSPPSQEAQSRFLIKPVPEDRNIFERVTVRAKEPLRRELRAWCAPGEQGRR